MLTWSPELAPNGQPRYIEIADAIARDIRSGILVPGGRLPPQRWLAGQLGLDFTTVSRGYAEARSRGLVESHVGRGIIEVHEADADVPPQPVPPMPGAPTPGGKQA